MKIFEKHVTPKYIKYFENFIQKSSLIFVDTNLSCESLLEIAILSSKLK
jgi:hypothetical protein